MHDWMSSPQMRTRVILIALLIVASLVVLFAAWTALVPFFLGLFLAYLLLPVVNWLDKRAPRFLQRHQWSRPLAIIIVYIILIGVVAGALSYFIPAILAQFQAFSDVGPTYIQRLETLITYDFDALLAPIPEQIRTAINANLTKAVDTLATGLQQAVGVTLRTVSQTVSFIIGMVIIPFWLFYVLNDSERMRDGFYGVIPRAARADVRCIVRIVDDLLSAYFRGQLLLCLLVGFMATIVLLIFGVDLALLLGTFAGIFEIVPILGPYIGAVPAILVAFLHRPIDALWVGLAFGGIQQLENIFLVPRISGKAVRFHPALVMVIVVIGAEIAGLWGLLLALPLAAMLRDVFQYLYLRTTDRGATPEMAMETLRARAL